MKKLFIPICFIILFFNFINAHPGIGIVTDSKENIYYTDLTHVWKVTPEGQKSIYVPNVHTHELFINNNDELIGENAWYEGEATDKWGFCVWKKSVDQPLTFVIDSTEGFLSDYPFSFVRDKSNSIYWHEKENGNYIFKKKSTDNKTETITSGKFENIRWQYWINGALHFVDIDDLYKIEKGKIKLITRDLRTSTLPFSAIVSDIHSIMGAWNDDKGNIYIAVFSGKLVKKISPDETTSNYFQAKGNWSPTGGLFDKNGNLWLLEYSANNQARVRKISADKLTKTSIKMEAAFDNELVMMVGLVAFLIGGLLFLRLKNPRKRK